MVTFEKPQPGNSEELNKARTVGSFTPGEEYIGYFQGVKLVETSNGKSEIYCFIDSDTQGTKGKHLTEIWKSAGLNLNSGANKFVNRAGDTTYLESGRIVKLTYEGMKVASSGRKFGAFAIEAGDAYALHPTVSADLATLDQVAEDSAPMHSGSAVTAQAAKKTTGADVIAAADTSLVDEDDVLIWD